LVQDSLLTPANTVSSNCTPSPLAPNLTHATNRGEHGQRLWWPHILVELLLNTCAVLHALSLNVLLKFLVCLLLGHDMADYWVVHHWLWLYSVAINNRCNRIALWRIRQKLGSIACNKEQQVLQLGGFSSLQGNHYRLVS
jgi:hypothetical protein